VPFERVAAIYDIHGNLPALEAILHEVQLSKVDQLVVGGDVVPGPMPKETIALLQTLKIPVQYIQGNGEVAVLAAAAGADPGRMPEQAKEVVRWTAQQLAAGDRRFIAGWPRTIQLSIRTLGEVLFCHSTPRNENEIFTRITLADRLVPIFDVPNVSVVICGHTHMQFDRLIGKTRVINAGSVGMPFGQPGADWLILGPDIQFRHTVYDLADAANRVRATDYPQAEDFAAGNILNPPPENQMLEIFSRAEIRANIK
jgi:predicted phosphodiesterase